MTIPQVAYRRGALALAAAAPFSGAAPQTVNGNAVNMNDVEFGTLSAHCIVLGDTNTITITAKWQGLLTDGSTWVDVCNEPQNPSGVALATGTAGADSPVERIIPAPTALYAYQQGRIVFTTGVASGGGAGVDQVTSQDYYYVRAGFARGF